MKARYQLLRDRLLQDFWSRDDIRVGFKLPTERDLGERYKVSRPTVAKAIAALAAEGWVTKRQGSRIYVAAISKPTTGESGQQRPRIGYIAASLRNIICHRLFEGIEHVAQMRGYGVEVANTNWDCQAERRHVECMREHGVHGVVLYPGPYRCGEREYLAHEFRDFPIVVVDLYQPSMKRPHFLFDNFAAGREMTRYLLRQGRREIAFLKTGSAVAYRSVDDRVAGYRRALQDEEVPDVEERVILSEVKALLNKEHCAALDRFLALKPRPTALITPEDSCAEASIEYLRARGVAVPEEVLVVGFDNLRDKTWGERFPTTQPDFVRMGERATEMLLERIASRNSEASEVVLPCPLLVPGSDGRLPSHIDFGFQSPAVAFGREGG